MRPRNRIVLFLCIILTALLLFGCSMPFAGDKAADKTKDNAQQEKADNGSGGNQEQQAAEVPEDQENKAVQGPELTVNLPATMSTEHEKLKVSGSTAPDCTVFVNGQTVRLRSDGTFSSEIDLNPGNNVVEVIAVDKKEASTQVERTVKYVTDRPTLDVFAPAESSAATVNISGYTDPDCVVYLNNDKVKADKNGAFTGTVKIKNKGNNTVRVTSVNDYGITTQVTKNIKGVAPKIQVAAPEMTTNDKATISGVADESSSIVVLIGSEQVSVNNNDGTFNTSLDLEPGLNDITVMATNLFGTAEVPLTILYDDYGK